MKSTTLLAACGALLATASPILQGRRLFVETDVVVEWVTVTVTEGDTSTVFRRPNHEKPTPITTSSPEPSSTPPPPPPPPPSSAVPEPVLPTPEPSPEPIPEPSPEPSPEPAPVAVAPVVEVPQPSPEAPEATPPTEEAPAAQPSDYQSTALYHHNIHRFNHSADALAWDDGLASSAETLAKRCVFEHDTSINGGGYGQNLANWGSSGDPEAFGATGSVARAASNGWYNNELYLFPHEDFGKDTPDMSNFMKWGHFSQLVWANTKKVGCYTYFCEAGTIYDTMGSWYTVCNYSPAGNMGGAYGDNVKPPLGQQYVEAA